MTLKILYSPKKVIKFINTKNVFIGLKAFVEKQNKTVFIQFVFVKIYKPVVILFLLCDKKLG